jgi:hypothetical protein
MIPNRPSVSARDRERNAIAATTNPPAIEARSVAQSIAMLARPSWINTSQGGPIIAATVRRRSRF